VAPVAPSAPADITYECIADVPAAGDLTATDNCTGDITVTGTDSTDSSDPCNVIITRTWIFTDACNNSSSVSQTITVTDTIAPTITTVAADQTVLCDGIGNTQEYQAWLDLHAGANAIDNCSSVDWTYEVLSSVDQCGATSRTLVRFIATDACNNSSTTTALFTILDLIPPTIDIQAADLTVECDGVGNLNDLNNWLDTNGGATASDLCGNVTWTNNFTALLYDCGETGSATVIFTATDACDNSSSTTATFIIIDTVAPVAPSAPADITYECIADVPAAGDLTATDNCAGDITVTGTDSTDSSDPCNVIITRTWTFTDACNNSTSVSQTITVADTTAPIVTNNLSDLTVNCDAIPDAPTLVFDDCSNDVTITYFNEDNSFDGTNNDYEIIWTWEFTDSCGNMGTASQIVYVTMTDTVVQEYDSRCIDDGVIDLFDFYSGTDMSGTWIVVSGNATLDGSDFDPSNVALGDYVFSYTVADNGCLSTTEVTLNINDDCVVLPAPPPCSEEDVVISKAITPNGDQWNEYFEVTGIETCGFVIDVKIFNRWGALIYESGNYQNNWSGTASKASVGNSNSVPTGTYYYILNLKNSGFKPFTGYVYIGTK
jgi:gliding motility-associated-like protein